MRGEFLHTRVLVSRIEDLLREFGAQLHREHYTRLEESYGYVDLLATLGPYTIVCEAELSADRAVKDVAKALALKADLLVIVVPRKQVAEAIRRRLHALPAEDLPPSGLEIWVLPLGPALQRLRNRCLLKTGLNVPSTSGHQTRRMQS